jgi:hypothetical protein
VAPVTIVIKPVPAIRDVYATVHLFKVGNFSVIQALSIDDDMTLGLLISALLTT